VAEVGADAGFFQQHTGEMAGRPAEPQVPQAENRDSLLPARSLGGRG